MQGGSQMTDAVVEQCLQFEASRDHKQHAFAKLVKTDRAKDFLSKCTRVEWEARTESFVSPALSRHEAFELALSVPEDLFFKNELGIIKSRGPGFRVMLDSKQVMAAADDFLYEPSVSQTQEAEIKWDIRGKCVVSQQLSWHQSLNYAKMINEDLFIKDGAESVGIVKSSGDGFRIILNLEKFKATPEQDIWVKKSQGLDL